MRNSKGQFVKGNIFTKEILNKMSVTKLGKPTWNKGKKLSSQHRKALSKSRKGTIPWNKGKSVPQLIGNTNGFKKGQTAWNKGFGNKTSEAKKIKNSLEYKKWREKVFERDNWTCQKCFIVGNKLHPHHIKSFAEYPELRFIIENGITLCAKCHKITENYGIRNIRIIRKNNMVKSYGK
jgi:5-methylcytosine-specific restriction endonuclease McrA